jgi:hypothetical protein
MTVYRCYFLTASNRITDTVEFDSDHDEAALKEARLHFARTKYGGFEVWEGSRCVHTELK